MRIAEAVEGQRQLELQVEVIGHENLELQLQVGKGIAQNSAHLTVGALTRAGLGGVEVSSDPPSAVIIRNRRPSGAIS